MMFYAGFNKISYDPFADCIEISREQYIAALEAMQSGQSVTIENGEIKFSVSPAVLAMAENKTDAGF